MYEQEPNKITIKISDGKIPGILEEVVNSSSDYPILNLFSDRVYQRKHTPEHSCSHFN